MIELKALQGQARYLVEDLRGQVADTAGLRSQLRREYEEAERAERTASGFEVWLDDVLDQAAVAWVLGCVFVRFCEDNSLVDGLWIGGDDPAAPADDAVQRRQQYIIEHPRKNDRQWLREAFGYLRQLRATGKIFDERNPLWRFDISGPAAENLSDFFRKGAGRVSLRSATLNTRFLGDLYQDLSVHAKKTYALLQTPEFVEEFILDRTFEPAVREFGLAATTVIDPTCGSGHFLLGAFDRLVRAWKKREPATDIRVLTERSLEQVTGVDINPFAVAIARFRLLIAAMQVCELRKLERTPAFPVRVATGDSLLNWGRTSSAQGDLLAEFEGRPVFAYESEDADLLAEYLEKGQYTVVVGNPPYITVADPARNKLYRSLYPTVCHRQYALTVPFAKRFFDLAKRADEHGDGAGHVGQITGNAFMKREFGKKLIEYYFAHEVELTEVIDTSGAYIPGHGTPTVILIGRANYRRRRPLLRTVLATTGEQSTPQDPAQGKVWQSILRQVDAAGSHSQWIDVVDVPRQSLDTHPWSLSGGGAASLMELLNASRQRLSSAVSDIGFGVVTREDSAYMIGYGQLRRSRIPDRYQKDIVEGDATRDWVITKPIRSIWPYSDKSLKGEIHATTHRLLWPLKSSLVNRIAYGNNQIKRGLLWFEYSMFFADRYRVSTSIAFAEISTHNHFVLDRSNKVFKQTAPIMKFSEASTANEQLQLLGVLNSSTACFWLKQTCFPKGGSGIGRGIQPEKWMERYAFNASNVEELTLPRRYPTERPHRINELAQQLKMVTPKAISAANVPTRQVLLQSRDKYRQILAQMISLQEELDWELYHLYDLVDEDLTHTNPPSLSLGERAFEIVMAKQKVRTEWFNRHGSKRSDEVNATWPASYQKLVERRMAAIAEHPHIGLIERPEYKRRWAAESWEKMQTAALRDWLSDRLEAPKIWDAGVHVPMSVAQLADRVSDDTDFREVLELWLGHENFDITEALGALLADEVVPFLPAQRYKPSGLRKRVTWERTWALQRREDAGEQVEIDVPPKYTAADFLRPSYWRARGKLDVPKERFISYPGLGRDTDGSELLGWAGWDHLDQARALATVYLDRKTQEAWQAHRLLPVLAGLVELEPWLHQWYTEERADFPGSPAQFFTDFINNELSQLSSDRSALALLRGVPEQG